MDSAPARAEDSVPIHIWIGFFAMIVGQFMALLDIQIVASAIGSIQSGVSASRDEVSWVQTAYLIAEVIGIPLSGFLAQVLGTRLLFCLSAGAFAVSSALCAFSWDINSLIVFRALQGFCGAAMIPTTMATLYMVMPRRHQPMAAAMTGIVATLAPSIGPTAGGFIAEALGWRGLFWINVPPAILCVSMVWRFMRLPGGNLALMRRVDIPGLIGLAAFLGSAEFVLEEGASKDWFASSEIVFFFCASLLGGALFFYRALRAEVPIVDLRPFQTPSFAIGTGLIFVVGLTLFTSIFLMPLFLGSVRGYNSLQIGHTMFMQGVVMFLSGPIIGTLTRRMSDFRPLGVFGFCTVSLSCWMQSHITADWGLVEFLLPQGIRGLGMVCAFAAITQPTMSSLPPHLVQAGTGIFNTMRNVGGAFGIAIVTTWYSNNLAFHRQELYSAIDPNNPHVTQMLEGMQGFLEQNGAADPPRQALMYYAQILNREAMVLTFDDLFMFLAVILAASAVMICFVQPRSRVITTEAVAVH